MCLIAGASRLGLLMHLALLLAVLLACLLPFAVQLLNCSKLSRTRWSLAGLLATVQFAFLLFYSTSIVSYFVWGAMPSLELIQIYAGQINAIFPLYRIQMIGALFLAFILWLVLILLYHRGASSLLSALGGSSSRRLPPRSLVQRTPRPALVIVLLLVLEVLVYTPTHKYWLLREPIHCLWRQSTDLNAMIPAAVLSGRTPLQNPYLAALPWNLRPTAPRNLILITVDALRSDQMGVYGAPFDDTPYLSSLFRSGKLKRIDSAYSVCTFSFCGMLGTFSSSYWHQLTGSSLVLADLLSHYGYQSHFLLSGDNTHFFGLRSFFSSSPDEFKDGSLTDDAHANDDSIVIPWLKNLAWSPRHNTFLHMHLMSVHVMGLRHPAFNRWQPDAASPWTLLSGQSTSAIYRNRYRNGVLQADDSIRQIFQILQEKGVLDQALVVITADHGEYLGEFGLLGHGHEPYEPVTRIPLLIYDQSATAYPPRPLTSQVDIAPSFLYAIGVPTPPEWAGIPLQLATTRNTISVASHEASGIVAQLGAGRFKYLRIRKSGLEELYDLDAENAEQNNLISRPTAQRILAQMRALHDQFLHQNGTSIERH